LPVALSQIVTPLWLKHNLLPSGVIEARHQQSLPLVGGFDGVDKVRNWINGSTYNRAEPLPDHLVRPAVASIILSGYGIIKEPKPGE